MADKLLDPLPHVLAAEFAENAPRAELIVAGRKNPLLARAGEHQRNVIRPESLAHAQHARQNLLADHERVFDDFQLAQADVARVARSVVPRLAEVLDQTRVPARDRRRVGVDFFQCGLGGRARCRRWHAPKTRFHFIKSPPEYSSQHSASTPSRPARPLSC